MCRDFCFLELYETNKVKKAKLQTSSDKFCVPRLSESKDKSEPDAAHAQKIFGCQFCDVEKKQDVSSCTTKFKRIRGLKVTGPGGLQETFIPPNTESWRPPTPKEFCSTHCIPGSTTLAPYIMVPDCESMCLFKTIMLSGTHEQRSATGNDGVKGKKKHTQDALDYACLRLKCKLNEECTTTDDKKKPEDVSNRKHSDWQNDLNKKFGTKYWKIDKDPNKAIEMTEKGWGLMKNEVACASLTHQFKVEARVFHSL